MADQPPKRPTATGDGNHGNIKKAIVVVVKKKRKLTSKKVRAMNSRTRGAVVVQSKPGASASASTSGRLPSFAFRPSLGMDMNASGTACAMTTTTHTNLSDEKEMEHDDDSDKNDDDEFDLGYSDDMLPTDTLVAIHSLITNDQGLFIPLAGNDSVQAVLERQVFRKFQEGHASVVHTELLELFQSNQLLRLSCQDTVMSTTALILTNDYIKAAWDAQQTWEQQQQHQEQLQKENGFLLSASSSSRIVSWFLSSLHSWMAQSESTTFSAATMVDAWDETHEEDDIDNEGQCPIGNDDGGSNGNDNNDGGGLGKARISHPSVTTITTTSGTDAVRHLLELQLLIRDCKVSMSLDRSSVSNTSSRSRSNPNNNLKNQGMGGRFQLWLPQWAQVLKAWDEGRKQILNLLARAPKRELSMVNLLRQNRHPYISTEFLLDDLVYRGRVLIAERPFGSFVQLARDG